MTQKSESRSLITTTGGLKDESDIEESDSFTKIEPTGYQLCEFCESSGEPHSVTDSLCGCVAIERSVASRPIYPHTELAMRIAESAVLNLWSRQISTGSYDVTISATHIGGGISDDKIVRLSFDGTLVWDLTETYMTEYGTAEIYSFSGDGHLRVRVSLDDELSTEDILESGDLL